MACLANETSVHNYTVVSDWLDMGVFYAFTNAFVISALVIKLN